MDINDFDFKKELLKMSGILKGFIICTGVLGLMMFFIGIPEIGKSILNMAPEFGYCYYPWLIFTWSCSIPYYIILFFAWKISDNIGKEKAFSHENELWFKRIFVATAAGVIFFLIINLVFFLMNMSHPGIMILSMIIIFSGSAFSFCARVLEKMCSVAASLKEQNDLTI